MRKLVLLFIATLLVAVPGISRGDSQSERGLEQLKRTSAQLCRWAELDPATCAEIDGRTITDGDIEQFEQSWVAQALALQRDLGLRVPLRLGTLAHTHNSYNSAAYDPTLSRFDHNQLHTISEQLRMGVRAIEIDVHWAPNVGAGGEAPTTCHAQAVATPVVVVHAGCTAEGTLLEALAEFREWLDDNPGEFVLLYLENALDGDADAHDAAAADIETTIGDLVYQPPGDRPAGTCADLPSHLAPADILATNKQVLITGNCGPGTWGDWVHPRGAWSEGSSGEGDDYPPAPECADRTQRDYDSQIIRVWEDATWLSHMVSGHGSNVTPTEVASMVRCGMNLIGFDLLRPDDGRLEALVWSWAPSEPGAATGCAFRDGAGFHAASCTEARPFACLAADEWVITSTEGSWGTGDDACAALGATFAVPRTGREDLALGSAAESAGVWLAYHHDGSGWVS
jgi:hypothetical protein